jgi:hypothetical protein
MIKESGISKQDQASNPQAILDVIGFMTDTQQMNEDDHAFSKFANFEESYADHLGAESIPASTTDNGTTPRSPILPKRPISPAKPPRRTNSKGESLSSTKIENNENEKEGSQSGQSLETHKTNVQNVNSTINDSQFLSKIPSLPSVKPILSSVSSKPVIPVKPNFAKASSAISRQPSTNMSSASSDIEYGSNVSAKPDLPLGTLALKQGASPASLSTQAANAIKSTKQPPPPVPARPSHTPSASSADVVHCNI